MLFLIITLPFYIRFSVTVPIGKCLTQVGYATGLIKTSCISLTMTNNTFGLFIISLNPAPPHLNLRCKMKKVVVLSESKNQYYII